MAGALGGGMAGALEEFKFQEDEDDKIDLLNEAAGLNDLKNALAMGIQFSDDNDLQKIKNNTIIGG